MNTLRKFPNKENQPQQRDHHSIERERSSSCPNIEAERQPILGKVTNWDNWVGIVGTAGNEYFAQIPKQGKPTTA